MDGHVLYVHVIKDTVKAQEPLIYFCDIVQLGPETLLDERQE